MRVVNISLLLLCGCVSTEPKWPVEPPPIPQSTPHFERAVQAIIVPNIKYYLTVSNPNPYTFVCVIESKTNINASWKYWSTIIHPAYFETNIPLMFTNSQEYFRAFYKF